MRARARARVRARAGAEASSGRRIYSEPYTYLMRVHLGAGLDDEGLEHVLGLGVECARALGLE